jgi:hypothetical protein
MSNRIPFPIVLWASLVVATLATFIALAHALHEAQLLF